MPSVHTRHRSRKKPPKHVFTRKQYQSRDGFLTSVWGPPLWHVLHTMSFNYPLHPTAQQKRAYKRFLLGLRDVLPCGACRRNLTRNLRAMPETAFRNRDTFSHYVYRLHELVNRMLGKTSGLTYCDVRERYEHFRARCTQPEDNNNNNDTQEEAGCTEPLHGAKSRCILQIVPETKRGQSLHIARQCLKRRTQKRKHSNVR